MTQLQIPVLTVQASTAGGKKRSNAVAGGTDDSSEMEEEIRFRMSSIPDTLMDTLYAFQVRWKPRPLETRGGAEQLSRLEVRATDRTP